QQVQTLPDGSRVAGALQVDVGPVPVGEVLDRGDHVGLGDVEGQVRAGAGRQVELGRGDVERDDLGRVLGASSGDHDQPDRATTGDDHHVVEPELGPLHR